VDMDGPPGTEGNDFKAFIGGLSYGIDTDEQLLTRE